MKILTIGDPHIGKLATIMGEEDARRRQSKLLRTQLALAKEYACDLAIIVGDLTDNPYPSQADLVEICGALGNAPTDVIVYLGNHDVDDSANTSFKLIQTLPDIGALRNVSFVTEPTTIKRDGARIRIFPWKSRYGKMDVDAADLILFHDDVVGALHDSGRAVEEGRGLPRSTFGGSTAIGGHIHTPQNANNVWFCGTAAQLSFGEQLPKRLLISEISRGNVRIRSKPFDPPWILQNVFYDPDDPPECNDPGTLYSLNISRGKPGPRWLIDHPRVVRVGGGSKAKLREITEKVADMATAAASSDADHVILNRWLRQYTSLDKKQRRSAIKLHEKMDR